MIGKAKTESQTRNDSHFSYSNLYVSCAFASRKKGGEHVNISTGAPTASRTPSPAVFSAASLGHVHACRALRGDLRVPAAPGVKHCRCGTSDTIHTT